MPTNVVGGGGRFGGGGASSSWDAPTDKWSTIGQGAQTFAGLLSSLMMADKASKQAGRDQYRASMPQPTGFGPGSSFGPTSKPSPLTPSNSTLLSSPLTRQPMEAIPQASTPDGSLQGWKPDTGGSMDGYQLPALRAPSVEYVESIMPQADVDVGPGSRLPNILNSMQMPGIAKTFSPLQTMMTRNFAPSTFAYGGL